MVKIFTLILVSVFAAPGVSHAQFFEEGHIVKDVRNNIVWLRCSVGQRWDYDKGQCTGETVRLSQDEITDAIRQANEQLGGSWRLPSLEELESIV